MLKQSLGKFQSQVGKIIKPLPITPNQLTILSVALAFVGCYYAFTRQPISLVYFLLAFAIDGLDGALARAKGLVSKFGGYLDGVSDRVVEFFALLPIIFAYPLMWPGIVILFFGTCMTSFSKAYADHREAVAHKDAPSLPTLFPRTERVIGIFIALALHVLRREENEALMYAIATLSFLSFLFLQYEVWRINSNKGEKR